MKKITFCCRIRRAPPENERWALKEMVINHTDLIRKHQLALEAVASEKTKQRWEKYMKGVIPFRGVGIPKNRELLAEWRKENGIDQWSLENQLDLALAFFNEPIAEDKQAGIGWNTLPAKFPI